jgi:hypothetical protein
MAHKIIVKTENHLSICKALGVNQGILTFGPMRCTTHRVTESSVCAYADL